MSTLLRFAWLLVGFALVGAALPEAALAASAVPHSTPVFALFDNPLNWLFQRILEGTFAALHHTINYMFVLTEPDIAVPWFKTQFGLMANLGAFLTLPVVLVATINALLKGGLNAVLKTYLVGLPVSLMGATIALAVVGLSQEICDNLTAVFSAASERDFKEFLTEAEQAQVSADDGLAILFFWGISGIFMLIGLLALWIELMARGIIIYMGVLFLPLAFAAFVWQGSRRWLTLLFEFILVMVFSKFLISATMALGFGALTTGVVGDTAGPGSDQFANVVSFIVGTAVVWMGVFSLPMIVNFVMRTQGGIPIDRRHFHAVNPQNNDKAYARAQVKSLMGLGGRSRGGGS